MTLDEAIDGATDCVIKYNTKQSATWATTKSTRDEIDSKSYQIATKELEISTGNFTNLIISGAIAFSIDYEINNDSR